MAWVAGVARVVLVPALTFFEFHLTSQCRFQALTIRAYLPGLLLKPYHHPATNRTISPFEDFFPKRYFFGSV